MPSPSVPVEVESLNFEEIGVRWTIQSPRGERRRYPSLKSLREALAEGSITPNDALSFDGTVWRPIRDIPDLRAYFWEVFKGVKQGRIQIHTAGVIGDEAEYMEDDAPTTLIRPDHLLQATIQQSLARELAARVEEKNLPPAAPPTDKIALPTPTPSPTPVVARASRRGPLLWVVLGLGLLGLLGVLTALVALGGLLFFR